MRSKAVALEDGVDAVEATLQLKRQLAPASVPLRLLRFGEVRQRTGLSRSTIWRMERNGSFPKRVKVSVNVVAWREDEVAAWIATKIQGTRTTGDPVLG
jgi:prophage regulatory protein